MFERFQKGALISLLTRVRFKTFLKVKSKSVFAKQLQAMNSQIECAVGLETLYGISRHSRERALSWVACLSYHEAKHSSVTERKETQVIVWNIEITDVHGHKHFSNCFKLHASPLVSKSCQNFCCERRSVKKLLTILDNSVHGNPFHCL